MPLEQGGARAGSGTGAHDFTARDARKDFLSFLGHMVTSAKKAHDTVEREREGARERESGVEVGVGSRGGEWGGGETKTYGHQAAQHLVQAEREVWR